MYTEGLQIGDNTYLLNEEDELVLATIEGTSEQMEEYIVLVNAYDEKMEEKFYLTDRLSEIHDKDKKARKHNIELFITTCFIEGLFVTLGLVSGTFPIDLLIFAPTLCIGIGVISKLAFYGTKKKRSIQKTKIGEEILEIKKEQRELKKKIDTLKNQIYYQEMGIYEDEVIEVTTIENKKVNVKMRVLRLDQSR